MPRVTCWDSREFEFSLDATALLVIDMQHDFLSPDGWIAQFYEKSSPLAHVVPKVRNALELARDSGLKVIHTREGYVADQSDVTDLKRSMNYVGREGPNGPFLIRGTKGHDFLEGFEPRPDEPVVDKAGFSAFHGTTLETILREKAITHLIFTGITTQCCVHSTLRNAVDLGYFCLTLEDCCAAIEKEVHDATMRIIQAEKNLFGWIASSSNFANALS